LSGSSFAYVRCFLVCVAHNEESFTSLCNYVNTLKGKKTLVLALQKYKNLNQAINKIESIFDEIIITETNIRNFISAKELSAIFNINKIKIINPLIKAIQIYQSSSKTDNIIIAGSHYFGSAISKEFKISFDNI
jgi:folylpolyglutamate synthase/dihydropteroate synthase